MSCRARLISALELSLVTSFTAQAQSMSPHKSGEQVYREVCMACHGTGMANAAGANWKDPDAKMMERIRARKAKRIEALKKKG